LDEIILFLYLSAGFGCSHRRPENYEKKIQKSGSFADKSGEIRVRNQPTKGEYSVFKSCSLFLLAAFCLFAADPDLRVSEVEAKKAAIEKPAPAYPMAARQLKIAGKAELEAIVSAEGSVEDVRIVSGNPILTRAGVDALKKWKFTPFTSNGKPVRVVAPIVIDFHL
jgi:TonB family protein